MKIRCMTRYEDLGASSRVRFSQYLPALALLAPDLQWDRQALLSQRYLRRKYAGSSTLIDTLSCYTRRATSIARDDLPDLWWVEKELWPYGPATLERALLSRRPFALDLDDAIFHNYDRHRLSLVRTLWGSKIDRLMSASALVTAGNAYLAERAQAAGASHVEIVPTVIDLERYPNFVQREASSVVDIAWIGTPATVGYLREIAESLTQLASMRRIRLVVIGGGSVHIPGVDVKTVPWSADTEAMEISLCQIGVMPLTDSPWERGKCGYKLIQYMACGLPVVASPVGVNSEIVQVGRSGLLANSNAQWLEALLALVDDAGMRASLGATGRARVVDAYSVQAVAPRLAELLRTASR